MKTLPCGCLNVKQAPFQILDKVCRAVIIAAVIITTIVLIILGCAYL